MQASNKPSAARWIVIALFVLVLAPYGLWRLFFWHTFAPNTGRANRGVAEFQAYLKKGGPVPASQPDVWSENGLTFFGLGSGAGLGFYYDVLCKSPKPIVVGVGTSRGVVCSCKLMSNDIYWLVLKN